MGSIVILVHGMGKHAAGEITKKFKAGMKSGLELLGASDAIKNGWGNHLDIREFYYDDTFEEHRAKLANNAAAIRNNTLPVSNWMTQLFQSIGRIDEMLEEDNALTQSWLDVAFYCHTFIGEQLRVELASEICKAIKDAENHTDVHIVAHSLGTALVHDTLHNLFRDDATFRDKIPDFPTGSFNLGSVTTVANVSRLTNLISYQVNPYTSRVTTGTFGCTDRFINVSNKYDPFLWLRPYYPNKHPSHVPDKTLDFRLNTVKSWNPHDFQNYIAYPEVTLRLVASLTTLDVSSLVPNRDSAVQAYKDDSVSGAAEIFEEKMGDFIQGDEDISFRDIYQALKKLFDEIQEFKEQYEADNGGSDA